MSISDLDVMQCVSIWGFHCSWVCFIFHDLHLPSMPCCYEKCMPIYLLHILNDVYFDQGLNLVMKYKCLPGLDTVHYVYFE